MATASTGKQLCLSFSGAGFLGVYHLGVMRCLLERGGSWLGGVDRFAGASSGAMIATIMALGQERVDIPAAQDFVMTIAAEMRKKTLSAFTPGVNIITRFSDFMHQALPDDAHHVVNGRLYLSVTNTRTRKNELISQFASKEELINYIMASCCVPGFNGMRAISINQQRYLDGGLTTNLPSLHECTTIRVSPFCGRVEICPRDRKAFGPFISTVGQDIQLSRVNISRLVHAIFPPNRSELDKYFQYGYRAALKFLFIREILQNGTKSVDNSSLDVNDIDIEDEEKFFADLETRRSNGTLNQK